MNLLEALFPEIRRTHEKMHTYRKAAILKIRKKYKYVPDFILDKFMGVDVTISNNEDGICISEVYHAFGNKLAKVEGVVGDNGSEVSIQYFI